MTQHVLQLRGCTPEPLGNYLKALGVFRLLAEQADPHARAWWKDGVFCVQAQRSTDELVQFFLSRYRPTPIFAPWGGRPGFFRDGNEAAKTRLAKILCARRNTRFAASAKTIREIRRDLRRTGSLKTKPKKEKVALITSSRSRWPSEALSWFDACLAIEESPSFGFLYGTGGNEGSADITNNFWELIEEVLGLPTPQPHAEETLRSALFATPRTAGTALTAGQHFPSAAESPNCGQGFVGSTSANPWDVILMMEGCVLFAGTMTKRLSQHGKGKAAFPFMLDHLATGEPQTSLRDEAKQDRKATKSRAEFWMPLWMRPMGVAELQALLAEGRLQRLGSEVAEHSVQALEAIASLGVSRGIQAFQRVGLFERRGKGYYVAASLGTHPVPAKSLDTLHLMDELAKFRRQAYRSLREGPGVPERVHVARQQMNAAFAELLKHHNQGVFRSDDVVHLLVAVALLEREVSLLKDRARQLNPCSSLSRGWLDLNLGDTEQRLARAIGGIVAWGERTRDGLTFPALEGIRANLEPVARRGDSWFWDDTSRSAMWARGASVTDNMVAVLRRRLMEAAKGQGQGLPLWSGYGARFDDLLALWQSQINEQRLSDLIHAFALVDTGQWTADRVDQWQRDSDPTPSLHSSAVWFDSNDEARLTVESPKWRDTALLPGEELRCAFALPRVYALLKLCFIGGRLPARPVEGETVARTSVAPYPPGSIEILNLLAAGRLPEAVETARRRLRAKGYPTIFEAPVNTSAELDLTASECQRLTGLLLVPVRHIGVLAALAIKPRLSEL